eukprot:scaffold13.g347.t1
MCFEMLGHCRVGWEAGDRLLSSGTVEDCLGCAHCLLLPAAAHPCVEQQELAGRAVPRLRALIVLPTRDLAVQVFAVLASLCPALGLRACLAAGRAGLGAEAAALAGGGVDVVVATPGRLIAHLEGTPGFTLEHLRFLVVDETDRLLRQAYHGWLPKVMAALEGGCLSAGLRSGAAPAGGTDGASGGSGPLEAAAAAPRRVVKLVVSATLTRDPSKIDRLGLHCPRYIAMSAVDHRHKLPRSLREFKLVAPAEHKPLALAALLARLGPQPTIVFAGSVEAAHRLHLLLSACAGLPGAAVEFSSLLRPEQRRASLEAFRSGAAQARGWGGAGCGVARCSAAWRGVAPTLARCASALVRQVLVCSDAMTRGMDVAGVACVINYDAPVYVKTYVHRAGRTARAGRAGAVYTLLRHEDVKLERAELDAVRPAVAAALDAMQGVLAAEVEAAAAVAAARAAGQREAGGQGAGGGGGGAAQAVGQAAAGEGEAPAAAHRKHKRRRLAGVQELVL